MKKVLAMVLALLFISSVPVSAVGEPPGEETAQIYMQDACIVVFEDNAEVEQIGRVLSEQQAATVEQDIQTPTGAAGYVMKLAPELTVEQAISQFEGDPAVRYAQPVFLYGVPETTVQTEAVSADETDDEYVSNQWYLDKVNISPAWDILETLPSRQGKVKVAVLDQQIQLDHPDLQANVNRQLARDFQTGQESRVLPDPVEHLTFHGTHVAGIIAATANNEIGVTGVASGPNNRYVEIIPINVFDKASGYEQNPTYALIGAIHYAKEQGVKVINMSLGTDLPYAHLDRLLGETIDQVTGEGVLVVSAGGNDNTADAHYPSDFSSSLGVISLYNTNYTNRAVNPRSDFSNYGVSKNLAAPGSDILSCFLDGHAVEDWPQGYAPLSGTSMASPVVAGVAAMIWYANPHLTPEQVWEILVRSALDLYVEGFDSQTGWGCVDAEKAVQMALDYTPQQEGWKEIDRRYFYYENGKILTGWQIIEEVQYYFNPAGIMATGDQRIDGDWYYFRDSGKMHIGWLKSGDAYYYYGADGVMQTGWLLDGDSWYYLDPSTGKMQTGWLTGGVHWYYLNTNGKMQTGWLYYTNGYWYYFDAGGRMVTGLVEVNGKTQEFDGNGRWIREAKETA